MANPVWPASLPQKVLVDGYSEEPQSQVIRTEMDAGPKKTRRRFTAATRSIPVSMNLDLTQLDTFETFFDSDLQGGSLVFDMPHPRTGATVVMQIVGDPPYRLTPIGGGNEYWRLAMSLEQQP